MVWVHVVVLLVLLRTSISIMCDYERFNAKLSSAEQTCEKQEIECTLACRKLVASVYDEISEFGCEDQDRVQALFDDLDPSCGYPFFGTHEHESTPMDGWITFREVMNDHYAFFRERGVADFNAVLSSVSKLPGGKMTSTTDSGIHYHKSDSNSDDDQDLLFNAIKESFSVFESSGSSGIGDCHLSVRHGDDEYVATSNPRWVERLDDFVDVSRYVGSNADRGASGKSFCKDNIYVGRADDGVLYIQILSFADYTDDNDSSDPKDKADVDAIASALNEIFLSSQGIRGVVLDLRFADGGWSSVAMQILAFFTDKIYQPVLRKRTKIPGSEEFLDKGSIWLHADSVRVDVRPFLGPLVVLQSRATIGAAEHLLLGLETVRRDSHTLYTVGTQTAGCLSDTLEIDLSLDMKLEVPNQRVEDSSGNSYETRGIGLLDPNQGNTIVPSVTSIDDRVDGGIARALGIFTNDLSSSSYIYNPECPEGALCSDSPRHGVKCTSSHPYVCEECARGCTWLDLFSGQHCDGPCKAKSCRHVGVNHCDSEDGSEISNAESSKLDTLFEGIKKSLEDDDSDDDTDLDNIASTGATGGSVTGELGEIGNVIESITSSQPSSESSGPTGLDVDEGIISTTGSTGLSTGSTGFEVDNYIIEEEEEEDISSKSSSPTGLDVEEDITGSTGSEADEVEEEEDISSKSSSPIGLDVEEDITGSTGSEEEEEEEDISSTGSNEVEDILKDISSTGSNEVDDILEDIIDTSITGPTGMDNAEEYRTSTGETGIDGTLLEDMIGTLSTGPTDDADASTGGVDETSMTGETGSEEILQKDLTESMITKGVTSEIKSKDKQVSPPVVKKRESIKPKKLVEHKPEERKPVEIPDRKPRTDEDWFVWNSVPNDAFGGLRGSVRGWDSGWRRR